MAKSNPTDSPSTRVPTNTTGRPSNSIIPIPDWGVILIIIAAGFLLLCCVVCACLQCCKCSRKKRHDKRRANMANFGPPGGDMSIEKVQPEFSDDQVDGTQQLGKLNFSIDYDYPKSVLDVGVIQCQNLIATDTTGSSDPYVKLFLCSHKKHKHETKIKKKTLNPAFNEHFTFKVPHDQLASQTVMFLIYDHDRFSKDDLIGQVHIDLKTINFEKQGIEKWLPIQTPELDEEDIPLGDICLSLRYVPVSEKLTVVVLEARNLKQMDSTGFSDPFVRLCLMNGTKRLKKKKSTIKKQCLNPYYNEIFTFNLPRELIDKVSLVVTVIDDDPVRNDPIGQIVLGAGSIGSEQRHWTDMLANPRRPIPQWHTLKEITKEEFNFNTIKNALR